MQRNRPRKPPAPVHGKRPSHQVRIIGGQWKRTPLTVLDAEGLRPTPDRVRETVFNWLSHLLDGSWEQAHCLDLFAGTGALGFEAASRGAARVVMVEDNAVAVRQLEATKEKLKAENIDIRRGDALAAASSLASKAENGFRVIFLDPPYHQDSLDGETPPDWMAGWEVVRADKAGMVFYHLLQRKAPVGI